MKYASQRRIGAVALWLGALASPAWADPVVVPDVPLTSAADDAGDAEGAIFLRGPTEASISISDVTGSVRMGQSASASLSATENQQAQYVAPPRELSPLVEGQVSRPTQPVVPAPFEDSVGFAQTRPANEILWRMGRSSMNQYGYNGGYTQFNAFAPLFSESGNAVTFINPRIGVTDYGMAVANVGAGQRFYVPNQDRVWGASFWYDYDNANISSFNQLGGSFESIGQYFSWRGNFSIPVGNRVADYGLTYGTAAFQGSNIAVPYTFFTKSAYQQYDMEATVPFPVLGQYGFDLGVGFYVLTGAESPSSTGVSVRTQAQITENLWLNGWYTYDHIFDSQFTINFEATMPNGRSGRWFRRAPVKKYLTQSVIRRYRVAVGTTSGSGTTLARDANGDLINVAYIDPNSTDSMGGAGTVENPYLSVADYMSKTAAERDIYSLIFVNPRNDATSIHLDTGIGLLDNQILVGNGPTASGNVPSITAYVNGTAQVIDLQITGTTQPFLSNAGASGTDVVTLANNNEVVGFKIGATNTANGISGTLINGFNIHDNTLMNVIDGIHITSDTSSGTSGHYGRVVDNTISGSGFGANNGVYIDQTAGTLNLFVSGNTISGFRGEDANNNNVLNGGEDADGDGLLDDGHGLFVQANGGNIVANNLASTTMPTGIVGNKITASGNGAQLSAINGSEFDLALNGNTVSNNLDADLGGINLLADNGSTFRVASAAGNTVSNNVNNGLSFLANDASTMTITGLTGNTISGNAGTGLTFRSEDAGTSMVVQSMVGNQISTNGPLTLPTALSGGVAYVANNSGSLVVNETTGNLISQNNGNGATFLADNSGSLFVRAFYGNSVTENTLDGVSFTGRNNGQLTVPKVEDLNQNGVLNSGEDLNSNGVLDQGFYGNIIASNLNNGVYVLADNSTAVEVHIGSADLVPETSTDNPNNPLRNQINDNGRLVTVANSTTAEGSGIYMTTLNGGTVIGGIDGNTVAANASAGIQIAPSDPGGAVNLTSINNNFILNNGLVDGEELPAGVSGGDSIVYAPSNGATFSVGNFVDNTISGNRGAIIRVGGDGGTIDLGTIQDTTFDLRTHGTSGILFDATNATITGTLINNIFIGSAENEDLSFGVGGNIQGGLLDLTIQGNLFDTTAGAGIGLILGASDTRPGPGPGTSPGSDNGVGTPIEGDSTTANLNITGNQFQNILAGTDSNFSGSAISIQLEGREHNNPDNPPVPTPDGSDPTNLITPGVNLTGVISGNQIGNLNSNYTTGDTLVTNAGPGIQILASGDSMISSMSIDTNIISNNRSDGIQVRRNDSAIIDNFSINANVIQNNLEDGIDIVGRNNGIAFGVQEVLNFNIADNQILNNGFLSDGTQGQAGRGIQLRGEAGAILQVDIDHNLISGNRLSGIEARTLTDTTLAIEVPNHNSLYDWSGGDNAIIYGTWENNIISGNGYLDRSDPSNPVVGGHGIALGRIDLIDPDSPAGFSTGIIEGFNDGGALVTPNEDSDAGGNPLLTIQNNLITDNAQDGLHVYLDKAPIFSTESLEFRTSRINVLDNDITLNGDDGFNLHNSLNSNAIVEFNNNLVSQNGVLSGVFSINQATGTTGNTVAIIGDGMEIITAGAAETTLNASNNRIVDNNGRGINMLTAGSGYLQTNFDGNYIGGNAREGFYLVNTGLNVRVVSQQVSSIGSVVSTGYSHGGGGQASASWLADFDSNNQMFNYGHTTNSGGNFTAGNDFNNSNLVPFFINWVNNIIGSAPVTDLTFTNNIVDNNGGVVSDANPGFDPYGTLGGFVIRVGTSSTDSSAVSSPVPFSVGGVRAYVTNNRMSGNYGRDVYFDGYIANEAPNVSVLPDPLVRMDLVFENNRGGSIDMSNFGIYYTNTAPVLSSPPGNVKRPNPPYTTATAQAGPRPAWLNLGTGLGGLNLPGYGTSTLRIEADGAGGPFGIGNNTFNLIYGSFSSFWQQVADGTLFP